MTTEPGIADTKVGSNPGNGSSGEIFYERTPGEADAADGEAAIKLPDYAAIRKERKRSEAALSSNVSAVGSGEIIYESNAKFAQPGAETEAANTPIYAQSKKPRSNTVRRDGGAGAGGDHNLYESLPEPAGDDSDKGYSPLISRNRFATLRHPVRSLDGWAGGGLKLSMERTGATIASQLTTISPASSPLKG